MTAWKIERVLYHCVQVLRFEPLANEGKEGGGEERWVGESWMDESFSNGEVIVPSGKQSAVTSGWGTPVNRLEIRSAVFQNALTTREK